MWLWLTSKLASETSSVMWRTPTGTLYFAYRDLTRRSPHVTRPWKPGVRLMLLAPKKVVKPRRKPRRENNTTAFRKTPRTPSAANSWTEPETSMEVRGNVFRGTGGIFVAERRLRLLIGLPSRRTTHQTVDEPLRAKIEYNWECSLLEALTRRAELRRQKWQIKKRKRNSKPIRTFCCPVEPDRPISLRGFGQDLFPNGGSGQFNNAVGDLVTGDFRNGKPEWNCHFRLDTAVRTRPSVMRNCNWSENANSCMNKNGISFTT